MAQDVNLGLLLRELASAREENARTRAENQGTREELRVGLQRLAETWAEDSKQRGDLAAAMTELAKTTKKHEDDIAVLKAQNVIDELEKTRAKTAIRILRWGAGGAFTILLAIAGALWSSYVSVRDASRDNTAAIATAHTETERVDRRGQQTRQTVEDSRSEISGVKGRLGSIETSLDHITEVIDDLPAARRLRRRQR